MLLVRPGHSLTDARGEFMGPGRCRGVDRTGLAQVKLLGRSLASMQLQLSRIYHTDVARAEDTANILAASLGGLPLEAALRCRHYGDADGKLVDEVLATFDPPLELSPSIPLAEGAETWMQVVQRTRRELEQITDRHSGETVLVVCDQDTIAASFQLYLDASAKRSQSIRTSNTAITEWLMTHYLDAEDDSRQPQWVLVRHNDGAHLAGPVTTGLRREDSLQPFCPS
ncbi:histidine phosphatase family protein [Nocardia niwae]|uniref:histidine phosphatase family protein n=1 Tax=Nocardia niwae TaxID=626084 RepID=UPI0033E97998